MTAIKAKDCCGHCFFNADNDQDDGTYIEGCPEDKQNARCYPDRNNMDAIEDLGEFDEQCTKCKSCPAFFSYLRLIGMDDRSFKELQARDRLRVWIER